MDQKFEDKCNNILDKYLGDNLMFGNDEIDKPISAVESENLKQLIETIRDRKNSSPDKSYTNKLLNDKNLSVSKVQEEIAELIESVDKNSNKIHEAADVIYHLMVYLEANDIKIEYVMSVLKKRQK